MSDYAVRSEGILLMGEIYDTAFDRMCVAIAQLANLWRHNCRFVGDITGKKDEWLIKFRLGSLLRLRYDDLKCDIYVGFENVGSLTYAWRSV